MAKLGNEAKLSDKTFDELIEAFSRDTISSLMTDGAKGVRGTIYLAMMTAIRWREEKDNIIAQEKSGKKKLELIKLGNNFEQALQGKPLTEGKTKRDTKLFTNSPKPIRSPKGQSKSHRAPKNDVKG